jgi:hypothetical protein
LLQHLRSPVLTGWGFSPDDAIMAFIMDIGEQIRKKKSESGRCLKEYLNAVQIADGNREAARRARQTLLSRIQSGVRPMAEELMVIRGLEAAQSALDSTERELAAKCDRICEELVLLHQEERDTQTPSTKT